MTSDDPAEHESATPPAPGLSRRALLFGAGAAGAIGVGAFAAGRALNGEPVAETADPAVAAEGAHQAGVSRPANPQQHCIVAVLDLDLTTLEASLAALGTRITAVTASAGYDAVLTPDGPGDLTVTIGLGAEALAATAYPELATDVAMPDFAGDAALPSDRRGGHLLVSVNASDPTILEPVLSSLLDQLDGARLRWSELGLRGPSEDGVARNPLGYFDGIIGPTTTEEFADGVWIADGPLAGGTVCVLRRFRLDTEGFRALTPAARDDVIGRRQSSGAPLSGGGRSSDIDLNSKNEDGSLLVPLRAHARAAHPSYTGSPLMLRRSYGYRASDSDHGLLFISYQNDVATFVRTQLRLDEADALMAFAAPTATAAFAILPGIRPDRPLAASLF